MMPKTSPCFCGSPSKVHTIQIASDRIYYKAACETSDCFVGRLGYSPREAAAFWNSVMAPFEKPEPCA